MYGKALLFVILVVVGAVLPYLLADEKFVGKLGSVFSGDATVSSADGVNIAPSGNVTKPTTAGKPVTIPGPSPKSKYDSLYTSQYNSKLGRQNGAAAIQPPVANRRSLPVPSFFSPATANANPTPRMVGSRTMPIETTSLVGPRGIPMEHLLNFNVTPHWISENWSRVTTRLAEMDLQGWRVPVSLEAPYDLIGSTTYYFDRQRSLQRIILHGFTTNPQPIVEMALTRYQMQRIPSYQTEIYVHGNATGPLGGLRIGSSSVRKARGRSEVLLELNREGSPFGMSYEFADELRNLQQQEQSLQPVPEAPILPGYGSQQSTLQSSSAPLRRSGGWFGPRAQSSAQPGFPSLRRLVE